MSLSCCKTPIPIKSMPDEVAVLFAKVCVDSLYTSVAETPQYHYIAVGLTHWDSMDFFVAVHPPFAIENFEFGHIGP